jgi:uncharacterized protein
MGAGHDQAAGLRETHVAVVFLLGDRAYKLKKAVDVGFLDFRTRQSRLAACQREVELNRRLAPDVYLGVADMSGVDGEVCDHLIVMRRMPDERRLSSLVRAGVPVADTIHQLARMVAAFHATAHRARRISAEGTAEAIRGRWMASFAQVDTIRGEVLDDAAVSEIQHLTLEFLDGRQALFDSRVRDGRIVDGHGDLLADDIFCLDDGPRVLDCLEFDDQLRWLDGLDDIAFLAMDLERLGAPELGELLLDRYAEFSGDPAPASLREHYLAYRAFVRVKVACLRHAQGDSAAAGEAQVHAGITLAHLRRGQVRLVLVGGLPGSGKTTVAGRLADELGAVLLSSDRLRKELSGVTPPTTCRLPTWAGSTRPSTPSGCTPNCSAAPRNCWPAGSRWCSTRPGRRRRTATRRVRSPGGHTARSSRCAARCPPRWPAPGCGIGPGRSPTPIRPSPPRWPPRWTRGRTRSPCPPSAPQPTRSTTPSTPSAPPVLGLAVRPGHREPAPLVHAPRSDHHLGHGG